MRFGGTHNGHGPRVRFDDDLRALAHAIEQRCEVARRFRIRDVDHFLNVIIYGNSDGGSTLNEIPRRIIYTFLRTAGGRPEACGTQIRFPG